MVELRVLGPVEMYAARRPVDLGPPKQRAVLAALVFDANQPVPMSALVERVWDHTPPPHARDVLYSHLSVLRRTLRQATGSDREVVAVLRRGGGYLVQVDPDRVDAHRFRRLVERARQPGTSPTAQAAVLRRALDLWRGPAVADLSSGWAGRLRHSWQQRRLAAARQWAEIELRVGRPTAVVEELLALTAEQPLVEPLLALLMRALHVDGRDAEALDHYTSARRRLAEELGVDPGSELRSVHQAILRGTLPPPRRALGRPTTAVPVPAGPASAAREPSRSSRGRVPAQLPADVDAFTGRSQELTALDRLLDAELDAGRPDGKGGRSTALVSVVSGTAGAGKTALAVHWAHRVREQFGDGQLYVNLRGYDPDLPLAPGDALGRLLSALGVAGQDIPLDVEDRAARYRTEMSGRRMLVLLDNAATVEQVRPLLPGTPTCAVVVTSRDSMAGLVALHGARRLDLDLLPLSDAIALLRTLIGDRVDAEPAAAATLAAHCARLPLALRVAAELAAARSGLRLSCLVDELADQRRRLDLLDAGGDPRAAVRGVFSWSLQKLPADAARAFRLLGLHPGPDCERYAAAALTRTTPDEARHLLELLTRAHLTHRTGPGRYGMHDLLRSYAIHLVDAAHGQDEQQATLTRLFDHYLAAAASAMDTLHPAEAHHRPRIRPPDWPTPPMADPAHALAWLDAERPNLVAICAHAAAHGSPDHATRLAATLFRYLDAGSHYPDALTVHTHAQQAARSIGDRAAEAHALSNLAGVHFQQGRHVQAAANLRQALALFREAHNRFGEARVLNNLGLVHWRLGRYGQAADHHRQALALYRRTGDRDGEADALTGLGLVHGRQGHLGRAVDHYEQALGVYRQICDRVGEAHARDNLGMIRQRQGRHQQAADQHEHALALFRETGNRHGEADALTNLGLVHGSQGDHTRALNLVEQALILYREIGDRVGEAEALNSLGETLRATGRPQQARTQHTAALALAVETGDRYEQARAHAGLGHGNLARGRHHLWQALTLYADLGVPDADTVRGRLTALGLAVTAAASRDLPLRSVSASRRHRLALPAVRPRRS